MGFYPDNATAAADGLLSYWTLDEASGTTLADAIGGRSMVQTTDPSYTSDIDLSPTVTPLNRGRAIFPDPLVDASRAMPAMYTPGSPVNTGGLNDFTVRLRYKHGSFPASQDTCFIVGGSVDFTSTTNFGLGGIYSGGRIWAGSYGNDAPEGQLESSTVMTAGNWYEIVFTRSGSTYSLYINGSAEDTAGETAHYTIPLDSSAGIVLGNLTTNRGSGDFSYFTDGVIDDVAIWDRALSAGEVSTLYNSGTAQYVIGDGPPEGALSLPVEITVADPSGTVSLPVSITVEEPIGALSLPISIDVAALGSLSVPLLINVHDLTLPDTWTAQVTIRGVDMTAVIVGPVVIEAEENEARVASLSIFHEGSFDPNDWINASVRITYQGGFLLFSGVVETPDYDMSTGIIALTCTDNFQSTLENATQAQVEAAIGGLYHAAVFGEPDNAWDYAQDRLSTLAASYDLDVNGVGRLGQWVSVSPDLTIGDSDYLSASLSVEFASRRDLTNRVTITVDHRYSHLRERRLNYNWAYGRSFNDYLVDPTTLPNSPMIETAIDGAGWDLMGAVRYERLPASQVVNIPGVGTVNWVISDDLRGFLCFQANWTMVKRWVQPITETHSITVEDLPNINATGLMQESVSYGLDLSYDSDVFLDGTLSDPGLNYSPIGSDAAWTSDDRDDLQALVDCAVARAKVQILGSHRNNSVRFTTLVVPWLERFHHVEIDCPRINATGKVRSLRHVLDFEQGSATTEIDLAVFRRIDSNGADGSLTLSSFSFAESAVQTVYSLTTKLGRISGAPDDRQTWTGYMGNYDPALASTPVYEERFVVQSPEIAAASTDPITKSATYTLQVSVPQDTLTINP